MQPGEKVARKGAVNLIFQGGGVKGAAYAHVLDSKPMDVTVRGVGGTSAGAIVAALIAAGRERELATLMKSTDLAQFIDAADVQRCQRVAEAVGELKRVWEKLASRRRTAGWWGAARWLMRDASTFANDLQDLIRVRGQYSTEPLRKWLRKHIGDLRFADVTAVADLRIVAANVSSREFRVYSKATYPQTRVIDAVVASASVPIFFRPFVDSGDTLVDGGILSNFPSFLFAQDDAPTIGFRLREIQEPSEVSSPQGFLTGLLLTMAEAHDKHRETPKDFVEYQILVPTIPATKFSLSPSEIEFLAEQGKEVGKGVKWKSATTPKRAVHYDPKPLATLDRCLSAATDIATLFGSRDLQPECLEETVEFTAWIQNSLDTRYECNYSFSVQGNRPFFGMRLGVALTDALIPAAVQSPSSIVDLDFKSESAGSSAPRTILLPVSSSPMKKDFLVFFDPPITSSSGPRRLLTTWTSPGDFRNAFNNGVVDGIHYSTRSRATAHTLRLVMTLNFALGLPLPTFEGEYRRLNDEPPRHVNAPDGLSYRSFRVNFEPQTVLPPGMPRLEIRFRWLDQS